MVVSLKPESRFPTPGQKGHRSRNTQYPISVSGLIEVLKEMILFILKGSKQIWIFIFIILMLMCKVLILPNHWYRKLEAVLVMGGAFTIIYYFTFIGRAPLRIWISVLMAAFGTLMCIDMFMQEEKSYCRRSIAVNLMAIVMICLGIVYFLISSEYQAPQVSLNSRKNADDTVYFETYHEDALYIWESNPLKEFMVQGKLPTENFLKHNIAIGSWDYGQVYFEEYLKVLNAENPARALLERENTYLVAEDSTFILNYLIEHYGDNITANLVGEINDVSVWKFAIE